MIAPLKLTLFGDEDETPPAPWSSAAVLQPLQHYGSHLFALLDGARDPAILPLLAESGAVFQSLFSDQRAEQLAAWSPYLVRVGEHPILEQLVMRGWGSSWGVYLASSRGFKALRRHFARHLIVQHNGADAYFRFYDPRVLRQHLPCCTPQQLSDLFGDVQQFFIEGPEAQQLLVYQLDEGVLRHGAVSVIGG